MLATGRRMQRRPPTVESQAPREQKQYLQGQFFLDTILRRT